MITNSKQISRIIGLMILTSMLAISCGRHHDSRLERIWDIVSDTPRDALKSLDSIDASSLYESDRAFYDLLRIKAKDKAYIVHTSDSLILSVIDYYTRHQDKELYPEALYYGGRVYSDLGDYPTALRYFQDALDLLPEGAPNLQLRGSVLSQTGRLLNNLGLKRQAIPYIENVLKINHNTNDTLNLNYNYELLGVIHLHLKDYKSALENFEKAEKWASYLPENEMVDIKMYKAAVHYHQDDVNTALAIIRPLPDRADSLSRNLVLSYASMIYRHANILDTAYMYACELANSSMANNRINGYRIMLSPKLRHFIPKDSLDHIYANYDNEIYERQVKQESNEALLQNSRYNYRMHDKLRQEAEQSRDKVLAWVIGLLAFICLLAVLILYMRYRDKNRVLELHEALAKIKILEQSLSNGSTDEKTMSDDSGLETSKEVIEALTEVPQKIKEEKSLKLELREKLKSLNEQTAIQPKVDTKIIESRPYIRIHSLLKSNKAIADDSSIWVELENLIQQCFPEFKLKLQLLSDGDLNAEDFHIAILLKCGFSLKQLAALLSVTKPAITYRRKQLSIRLFGEVLDLRLVDNIIRSL